MINYYLITFKNTHSAISGEKALKSRGLDVIIMPTPTSITKSCGISIKLNTEDFKIVSELIEKNELEAGNIYFKNESEYKLVK